MDKPKKLIHLKKQATISSPVITEDVQKSRAKKLMTSKSKENFSLHNQVIGKNMRSSNMVEDRQNVYGTNIRPINPNIRPNMMNYNFGRQGISVYQQPPIQYYQASYVPNIIPPYSNLQHFRNPTGIQYYYYPI